MVGSYGTAPVCPRSAITARSPRGPCASSMVMLDSAPESPCAGVGEVAAGLGIATTLAETLLAARTAGRYYYPRRGPRRTSLDRPQRGLRWRQRGSCLGSLSWSVCLGRRGRWGTGGRGCGRPDDSEQEPQAQGRGPEGQGVGRRGRAWAGGAGRGPEGQGAGPDQRLSRPQGTL